MKFFVILGWALIGNEKEIIFSILLQNNLIKKREQKRKCLILNKSLQEIEKKRNAKLRVLKNLFRKKKSLAKFF